MTEPTRNIETPQEALLFLDYLAKFGVISDAPNWYGQIAVVIRTLMRRLEEQAMAKEQAEARGKG
jgi:hypothetical protein